MALFDDMYKKINTTGQSAIKKAKELADITSLNLHLSKLNKDLEVKYAELGQKYYELNSQTPQEELSGICTEVNAKLELIKSVNLQIQSLKNARICPSCGQSNETGSTFCVFCGSKIPEPVTFEQATAESVTYCKNCSAELNPTSKFCSKCGEQTGPND